jgi:rubrerythrin
VSQTIKNLEAASAGESMANRKYFFLPSMPVETMLQLEIAGETCEYTTLYP